jgi:NAD(P)-dependent dehydrogenase (short-subunit alcohol dehydrogenase family)
MATLQGKVAIITGATSGIGERIAEAFVEEGAEVVVAARREAEGNALEKRLSGVSFIRTDVAEEPDVRAMVEHTMRRFSRIECLVNNAGTPAPMISLVDIDADSFDRVMAVNARGVFLGIKYVAPVMWRRAAAASSISPAWRVCAAAHRVTPTPRQKEPCSR